MASGAPKLNLTAEEKHAYGQLFRLADTDNVGVVTGEVAVKFFEKTRLDSRVLGEVGCPSYILVLCSLYSFVCKTRPITDYCFPLLNRSGKSQTERTAASLHQPASVSCCD